MGSSLNLGSLQEFKEAYPSFNLDDLKKNKIIGSGSSGCVYKS